MYRFGLLFIILLASVFALSTGVQRCTGQAGADNEFEGKALTVITKSNPRFAVELEKVRVKKFEGRSFLVGVGADTPNNWQVGQIVWIAVDDVSMITVYASVQELRRQIMAQPKNK